MSNFKERQASAKKVIQLQNEVLSLKQKLSTSVLPEPCEDCASLREEIDLLIGSKKAFVEEIASLKADLKEVRSENTRLKKKIKDASSEEED